LIKRGYKYTLKERNYYRRNKVKRELTSKDTK
jgi:hypothetical protein